MTSKSNVAQYTQVADIMTRGLVSVGAQEGLLFAFGLMSWFNIRHLPVIDGDRLVGVVSERDLLMELGGSPKPNEHVGVVETVMARSPTTTTPDESIGTAAASMATLQIGCLPVLDGGELVGILTATDIVAHRGGLFFKNQQRGSVPDVTTIMRRRVEYAHAEDPLVDAVSTMLRADVRHLPVVDDRCRVVALLSDRDVRSAVGDPVHAMRDDDERNWAFRDRCVADAAMPDPFCVTTDTTVYELADCFLHDRFGAVPVVDDDNQLLGIVSYIDLLRFAMGRSSDTGDAPPADEGADVVSA